MFALDEEQEWYRCGGGGWSEWYGFAGDNKLYQRYQTAPGVWSGWESMGDKLFTSSPAATSWGSDHLEVFALGDDKKGWHKWYDFGARRWSDWYVLAGDPTFKEAPAAVSWAPGRVNIFALGVDDRIWTRHLTGVRPGEWSDWAPMGDEKFTSAPAAASWTRWVN